MSKKDIPKEIADSLIKNVIDLDRFSEHLRKQIVDLLVKAQQEIEHSILDIDPGATTITEWQRDRFQRLDTSIKRILDENYGKIKEISTEQLTGAAKIIGEKTPAMLNAAIGVNLFDVTLTPELLENIATNSMIDGHIIGEWWDKQNEDTRLRLRKAMEQVRIDLQLGLIKGESIGQLIGKVRGTKIIPGPFAASKAQAAAVARTSTMQVLQATRMEVYRQNKDVYRCRYRKSEGMGSDYEASDLSFEVCGVVAERYKGRGCRGAEEQTRAATERA